MNTPKYDDAILEVMTWLAASGYCTATQGTIADLVEDDTGDRPTEKTVMRAQRRLEKQGLIIRLGMHGHASGNKTVKYQIVEQIVESTDKGRKEGRKKL